MFINTKDTVFSVSGVTANSSSRSPETLHLILAMNLIIEDKQDRGQLHSIIYWRARGGQVSTLVYPCRLFGASRSLATLWLILIAALLVFTQQPLMDLAG
jgi:hypothetical protein